MKVKLSSSKGQVSTNHVKNVDDLDVKYSSSSFPNASSSKFKDEDNLTLDPSFFNVKIREIMPVETDASSPNSRKSPRCCTQTPQGSPRTSSTKSIEYSLPAVTVDGDKPKYVYALASVIFKGLPVKEVSGNYGIKYANINRRYWELRKQYKVNSAAELKQTLLKKGTCCVEGIERDLHDVFIDWCTGSGGVDDKGNSHVCVNDADLTTTGSSVEVKPMKLCDIPDDYVDAVAAIIFLDQTVAESSQNNNVDFYVLKRYCNSYRKKFRHLDIDVVSGVGRYLMNCLTDNPDVLDAADLKLLKIGKGLHEQVGHNPDALDDEPEKLANGLVDPYDDRIPKTEDAAQQEASCSMVKPSPGGGAGCERRRGLRRPPRDDDNLSFSNVERSNSKASSLSSSREEVDSNLEEPPTTGLRMRTRKRKMNFANVCRTGGRSGSPSNNVPVVVLPLKQLSSFVEEHLNSSSRESSVTGHDGGVDSEVMEMDVADDEFEINAIKSVEALPISVSTFSCSADDFTEKVMSMDSNQAYLHAMSEIILYDMSARAASKKYNCPSYDALRARIFRLRTLHQCDTGEDLREKLMDYGATLQYENDRQLYWLMVKMHDEGRPPSTKFDQMDLQNLETLQQASKSDDAFDMQPECTLSPSRSQLIDSTSEKRNRLYLHAMADVIFHGLSPRQAASKYQVPSWNALRMRISSLKEKFASQNLDDLKVRLVQDNIAEDLNLNPKSNKSIFDLIHMGRRIVRGLAPDENDVIDNTQPRLDDAIDSNSVVYQAPPVPPPLKQADTPKKTRLQNGHNNGFSSAMPPTDDDPSINLLNAIAEVVLFGEQCRQTALKYGIESPDVILSNIKQLKTRLVCDSMISLRDKLIEGKSPAIRLDPSDVELVKIVKRMREEKMAEAEDLYGDEYDDVLPNVPPPQKEPVMIATSNDEGSNHVTDENAFLQAMADVVFFGHLISRSARIHNLSYNSLKYRVFFVRQRYQCKNNTELRDYLLVRTEEHQLLSEFDRALQKIGLNPENRYDVEVNIFLKVSKSAWQRPQFQEGLLGGVGDGSSNTNDFLLQQNIDDINKTEDIDENEHVLQSSQQTYDLNETAVARSPNAHIVCKAMAEVIYEGTALSIVVKKFNLPSYSAFKHRLRMMRRRLRCSNNSELQNILLRNHPRHLNFINDQIVAALGREMRGLGSKDDVIQARAGNFIINGTSGSNANSSNVGIENGGQQQQQQEARCSTTGPPTQVVRSTKPPPPPEPPRSAAVPVPPPPLFSRFVRVPVRARRQLEDIRIQQAAQNATNLFAVSSAVGANDDTGRLPRSIVLSDHDYSTSLQDGVFGSGFDVVEELEQSSLALMQPDSKCNDSSAKRRLGFSVDSLLNLNDADSRTSDSPHATPSTSRSSMLGGFRHSKTPASDDAPSSGTFRLEDNQKLSQFVYRYLSDKLHWRSDDLRVMQGVLCRSFCEGLSLEMVYDKKTHQFRFESLRRYHQHILTELKARNADFVTMTTLDGRPHPYWNKVEGPKVSLNGADLWSQLPGYSTDLTEFSMPIETTDDLGNHIDETTIDEPTTVLSNRLGWRNNSLVAHFEGVPFETERVFANLFRSLQDQGFQVSESYARLTIGSFIKEQGWSLDSINDYFDNEWWNVFRINYEL